MTVFGLRQVKNMLTPTLRYSILGVLLALRSTAGEPQNRLAFVELH